MHAHDASQLSLDGMAFRKGELDNEFFFFDGRDYTRVRNGNSQVAWPQSVYGKMDWMPNAPKKEFKNA